MSSGRHALALLGVVLAACSDAPVPAVDQPQVEVAIDFGAGDDISDARYTVTIAARGVTIATRSVSASALGGEHGHAILSLPCDPDPAAQPNAVTVAIEGFDAHGEELPPREWADPGPVTHFFTCSGEAPQLVPFDHAIGRHVAVGVQFDDVFCSAKFDCRDDFIDPVGPAGTSAVLGFACTAGPGVATALYLSDIALVCDDHYLQLSPSFEGRRPLIDDLATAAGTYFGEMSYSGLDMCFWDNAVALPMEVGAASSDFKNCHLLARGTVAAGDVDALPGGVTPPDAYYPYVRWDVPLTDAAGALTCASHALWGASGAVSVQYAAAERAAFRWPYACGPMTAPTQVCGGFGPPVGGSSDPATGSGTQIVMTQGAPGTVTVTIGGVQKTVQLPAGVTLDEEAGCCIDPCCQVAPPGTAVSPEATVPQGDLVAWLDASVPASYPGSGTSWHDLSGNGNDFTLQNGPTFDATDPSLVFDGVDDIAASVASLDLSSFDCVTVEIVVRSSNDRCAMAFELTPNWNGNDGSFGLALSCWGNTTQPNEFHTSQLRNQTLRNYVASIGTGWAEHVNQFCRVADPAGRLTWVNGAQVSFGGSYPGDTTTPGGTPFANATFYLGGRGIGGVFMSGRIARVLVYGRKLSNAEVADLYGSARRLVEGGGPPPTVLVDLGGGVRGWSDGTLAASCRAYRLGDNNRHYQGAIGDGLYRIDPAGGSPFNVWCDMVFDGGGWTRVFFEDTADGFFAVNELEKNKADPLALRYAILNDLESFRRGGAFELKMNWPGDTTWTGYQHWSQTSNPVTDTPGAIPTGVIAHHVAYTSRVDSGNPSAWYGLQRSVQASNTLLDGSMSPVGDWWYAIGVVYAYNGPAPKWQPGPDFPTVQKVELWVR